MAVPRQDVRLTGPQQLRVEIELSDGTAQTLAAVAQEIDDPDGPAAIDLELSLVEAVLAGFVRAEDGEGEVEPPKVVVTATSTVAGRLAGTAFSAPLEHRLVFGLDRRTLRLLADSQPVLTVPGELAGSVKEARQGSVPLLGEVALGGILVAAIVAALLGLALVDLVLVASLRERGSGGLRRARRRYAHLIVDVAPGPLPERIVEVPTMSILARIATRLRRPILEISSGPLVEFVVLEPGLAYCHRIRRPRATGRR